MVTVSTCRIYVELLSPGHYIPCIGTPAEADHGTKFTITDDAGVGKYALSQSWRVMAVNLQREESPRWDEGRDWSERDWRERLEGERLEGVTVERDWRERLDGERLEGERLEGETVERD